MIVPHRRQRRLARDEDALIARIANQPHRRGERGNIAASPWQRLLKAGTVRDPSGRFTASELEAAGLRFCEAKENYAKAVGSPWPFAVDSHGKGGDITPALRKKWLDEWADILIVLRKLGRMTAKAVNSAAEAHPEAEERLWPDEMVFGLQRALIGLSGHFAVRR